MSTHVDPPGDRTARHAAATADAWAHNARIGLLLFFVYLAAYAGFIWMSAFRHDAMARPVLGGVNLAVVYGMGLIFGAFVMAMLYMLLCRAEPPEQVHEASEAEIEAALGSEGTP